MISLNDIASQCDVKHIMMPLIKAITSVLNVSAYIITSITARPMGLGVIPAIMSVSTFKAAVFLYTYIRYWIKIKITIIFFLDKTTDLYQQLLDEKKQNADRKMEFAKLNVQVSLLEDLLEEKKEKITE